MAESITGTGKAVAGSALAGGPWPRLLRQAGFATLVAFGLFALMIGIRTDQSLNNQLVLVPRPGLLAGILAAVFLGSLGLGYLRHLREQRARQGVGTSQTASLVGRVTGLIVATAVFIIAARAMPFLIEKGNIFSMAGLTLLVIFLGLVVLLGKALATRGDSIRTMLVPAFLGFIAVFPLLALNYAGWQGALKWIDNFGIQILIYVMLGWGLNIVVGLAGLLDLGYVAFYAVGAYSYALFATSEPLKMMMAEWIGPNFWSLWAFWICLPVAGILAAFWGVLLGFPVLRLRGDYLAIVTLAFGEIIRLVLINWVDFSNGYAGISSIPRPSLFGIPFNASDTGFAAVFGFEFSPLYRTIFLYYLILVLALFTALVATRLRRLPVGRAWEALREDEIACRSLGINTVNTKLTAFSLGAMFGGFAGAFFAARQGFISPESFTFIESAQVLAIVVLGGSGSLLGVVIGAIVLVGGFEILRELEFLRLIFGSNFDPVQYRGLIFGLGMVLIMIWKPRGLISSRQPTVFLKEKRRISGDLISEGHG